MHWISLGLYPGWSTSSGGADDLNRLGSYLGAMAQSHGDQGPDVAPRTSDLQRRELAGGSRSRRRGGYAGKRPPSAPQRRKHLAACDRLAEAIWRAGPKQLRRASARRRSSSHKLVTTHLLDVQSALIGNRGVGRAWLSERGVDAVSVALRGRDRDALGGSLRTEMRSSTRLVARALVVERDAAPRRSSLSVRTSRRSRMRSSPR